MDKGEAQGVRLPKKPRRRAEGSEAQWEDQSLKGVSYGAHYRGIHRKVVEKRMSADPSVLGGGRGGGFHSPPANYQGSSLNYKQPVPTLAGEICSFIQKVSICRNK